MQEDEQQNETDQSCFDILISSLIDGVMHDNDLDLDEDGRAFVIDEILNVLEDHLDEEGFNMLNEAYEKFEVEYELQLKTEDIINSLEWHKDDDTE